MYRSVLALFAAAVLVSAPHRAVAADTPIAAQAPVIGLPGYNWTGFYVGINVGGGWASTDWTNVANTLPAGFGDSVPMTSSLGASMRCCW